MVKTHFKKEALLTNRVSVYEESGISEDFRNRSHSFPSSFFSTEKERKREKIGSYVVIRDSSSGSYPIDDDTAEGG